MSTLPIRTAPRRSARIARRGALAMAFLVPALLPAQPAAGCAGQPACTEVSSFTATVTDFRTSVQGRNRLAAATIRFHNRTDQVLRLAYVDGSGLLTDDQGNRYGVYANSSVRGLGVVTGSTFDPKFELQPGESSDARIEFYWQPGREIIGTRFTGEMAIREIVPVTATQFRLGREHALQFRGLADGVIASAGAMPPSAAPATPAGATPGAAVAVPAAAADACAGQSRCYDAGPFTAQVSNFSESRVGNYKDHVLRFTLRIRNRTNQPLVLAYKAGTSLAVDQLGNRYAWGRPGTSDGSATGIGIARGQNVDAQFALAPGQARDATFQVWRRPGRSEIGTVYSYDVALVELQPLNGGQVRLVRDYSLGFRDLRVGSASTEVDAAQAGLKLLQKLSGKIRKP